MAKENEQLVFISLSRKLI